MSYILEALKKAQAERQLGNAPTIHAPPPVQAAPVRTAAARTPLLIGLAAGVVLASVAAVFAWRHQAPVQVAMVTPAPQSAPAQPPAAPAAQPPAQTQQEAVAPVPKHSRPARVAKPVPAEALAAPATVDAAAPHPTPAPAARAPQQGSAPVLAAAQDNVRNLKELPEAIQRDVPKVAFGGYIYSPNPADRLLLIDKTLRHEGEEVAPGLVLEKLLPKAAVMNYRGYRYRVAY